MTRDGFAGESGGVELGSTLNDCSIDGHALAWLDYDDASARHLVGVYLLKVAFGIFDVCIIGRDIHHGANGLAALSYGVGLEELSHLVKEHNGCSLCHVRVGVWKKHHSKSAERGHGHEEALVKCFAVTNVIPGFFEHVMAGDDKWHEEEHEACVNVPGVSKGSLKDTQFIHRVYRDKDCKRYKDAIAFVLE